MPHQPTDLQSSMVVSVSCFLLIYMIMPVCRTPVKVMNWCLTNSPGDLGMAESYVHVLASVPHARLRLEALNTHHHFSEDVAKQVCS